MPGPRSLKTGQDPRLHLRVWSERGVGLLLTHGMAGNTHWWNQAAPRLAPAFRPAALDFRGHGDSDWRADGRYDTDRFIEDIEDARRLLGWERMVLGGHSLGGRIVLEYGRRHPERLLGLVAVDFLPEFYESKSRKFERTRTRPQPVYADRERMVRRFHLEPPGTVLAEGDLRDLAENSLRPAGSGFTWKFDWRSFLYPYAPVWPALPRLRIPVLVVRGQHSTVMNRSNFERVVREIPGARGVEIPGAFHHVPLDAPEALAAEMLRFLEDLPARTAP